LKVIWASVVIYLAVLELSKEMELTEEMNPICLPTMQNEDEGTGSVTVAGWGSFL